MATLHSSELLLGPRTHGAHRGLPEWVRRVRRDACSRPRHAPPPAPGRARRSGRRLRLPPSSRSPLTGFSQNAGEGRVTIPDDLQRAFVSLGLRSEFSSKSREGRPADSPVDTNRVIQTRLSLSHSGLRERHAPTHPSLKLLARGPLYPHQNDRGPRGTFLGCILFIDILLR